MCEINTVVCTELVCVCELHGIERAGTKAKIILVHTKKKKLTAQRIFSIDEGSSPFKCAKINALIKVDILVKKTNKKLEQN